jgi:hypothetical protein
MAGIELTVMAHTIGKLVEGEITPALADGVVSALRGLRSALDFNGPDQTGPESDILPSP